MDKKEAPHFTTLGAPVDAEDALLKFAYNRQVAADPEQTPTYLEALGTLSARRSEELQMFVFTHQELLAAKRKEATAGAPNAGPTEKAYAHFGLARACAEDSGYFIRVYRTYRDQSPAQKSEHRLALLEIGKDRNSDDIRNEVFGKQMDLPEACQFLSVEPGWPMDNIAAMAQSVALVCLAARHSCSNQAGMLTGFRTRTWITSISSSWLSTLFHSVGRQTTPTVPASRVP
jgi:ubiquitin carboxyl-terminal hydrolase 25/28